MKIFTIIVVLISAVFLAVGYDTGTDGNISDQILYSSIGLFLLIWLVGFSAEYYRNKK